MLSTRVNCGAILSQMSDISKVRHKFMSKIFQLFLLIPGRINFLQMGRWGDYHESRYRAHFESFFDFADFNRRLVAEYGSPYIVLAFDPSFISKSGKHTPYKGYFWSGCAQQSKPGLEISNLSAIDITRNTAYHLDAIQTPDKQTLQDHDVSLMQHYIQTMIQGYKKCSALSNIMTADGYFSKKELVDAFLEQTDGIFISKLRSDAHLKYLYTGPKKEGRGAPRKYTGKVDLKKIDHEYFTISYTDSAITIYDVVVYSVALKRNIRIAYTQYFSIKGDKRIPSNRQIYFSTDLNVPAWYIAKFYKHRFQQEFINRDGKQHTGLCEGQSRSLNKMDFHFNASCTAVSIAKLEHELAIEAGEKLPNAPCSIADTKLIHHNQFMVNRIFDLFAQNPNLQINSPEVKNLYFTGCIAA